MNQTMREVIQTLQVRKVVSVSYEIVLNRRLVTTLLDCGHVIYGPLDAARTAVPCARCPQVTPTPAPSRRKKLAKGEGLFLCGCGSCSTCLG